jgi:hypothetical protein
MGNPNFINDDRLLLDELDDALNVLERTTGIKGRVVARNARLDKGREADAIVELHVDRKKHRYVVEAKTRVDRLAMLGHIKAQLDEFGERGLLFAPYITTTVAQHCRNLDIPFLDLAGNAYLHEHGLYIYVTGEKPQGLATTAMRTQGAGTATALRVIFALLCKPDLLNAPYRDIVEAADVALGAVGWIFLDLEKRGYIAGGQKRQNRRFLQPARLLEEWVTNYPIKLRPKLNPRRFRAENPEWWKHAHLAGLDAYWGGEIAAQRLTRYLKPATCTLYIRPYKNHTLPATADPLKPGVAIKTLAAAHHFRADPDGDIEVLDAFWHLPPNANEPDVVPPILVYADLIATLDPRNLETAKLIRDKYINDALVTG